MLPDKKIHKTLHSSTPHPSSGKEAVFRNFVFSRNFDTLHIGALAWINELIVEEKGKGLKSSMNVAFRNLFFC